LVLFVFPHFTYPGGAGKFVLETADRLAKRGLETAVLALSANADVISGYHHIQFHFVGGPLPNTFAHWIGFPSLARRIEQTISRLKPDVLFPQVFPANYWSFLYKRSHRDVPCIWFCQEPSAFVHNVNVIMGLKGPIKAATLISNPLFQLVDRKLVSYADKILANSQYTAGLVKKIYRQPAEVVYPGVDIDRYTPSWRKEEFIFVVGRLTRFKRIDLVLKAIALAKQRGDKIPLIIGGDGEERAHLTKLAQRLKLNDRVQFAGRLSDEELLSYLRRARFVVFPTTNEPFGLVPVEAMACGTPVIVSNSGGPRETVIEGETGLLFKAGSDVDLADKMQLMWNNGDLINRMSLNARKHAEEKFGWDGVVDRLAKIFQELPGRTQ
jgi:glycosyltransferase involved in cell wall biosynthesis